MRCSLEIAYQLSRGSFNWLFTIDDLLMVIPYFWCYMLSTENDVGDGQRHH